MTGKMHSLGELIHQRQDEHGLISVYQKHHQRFLTFGNSIEQSCYLLDHPCRLEHVYTQAMMLGLLLHEDVRSVLLLGLGGGSLVRALRHVRAKLGIHAVEYRQPVIDIAQQFFALPDDKNLHTYCDDAQRHLQTESRKHGKKG